MARPGLYDAIIKLDLLDRAHILACGDGSDADKASRIDVLIGEAGGSYNVTPRAVFILRHKLEEIRKGGQGQSNNFQKITSTPSSSPPPLKKVNGGKREKKEMHPHDGRRQNKGTPPPGPHSSGFKPGNDFATETGVTRNPLLHGVSAERRARASAVGKTPADLLLDDIETYRLHLMDMIGELEAVKTARTPWVQLGSTYTRQEGDGELMGTGRISQRKRIPRLEAITRLSKDIAYIQTKYDNALKNLHDMTKSETPPGANTKQYLDALNATAEEVWGEEENPRDKEGLI